jgi:hypothetical protein
MIASRVEPVIAGYAAIWVLNAGSQKPLAGAEDLRKQTASVTERLRLTGAPQLMATNEHE